MKNFRQLIPAILICVLVIGGVAFAAWTAPTCTPPACNNDEPIDTGPSDIQIKRGGLSTYKLGSVGNIYTKSSVFVGADASSLNAGLYLLTGNAYFKNKVYIGDHSSIDDDPSTTSTHPVNPAYDLTLKQGATTNIGMGDTCYIPANDLWKYACPRGSYISNYNAADTNHTVRCTTVSPSDGSLTLEYCYDPPPFGNGQNDAHPTARIDTFIDGNFNTNVNNNLVPNDCRYTDTYKLSMVPNGGVPPLKIEWLKTKTTDQGVPYGGWIPINTDTLTVDRWGHGTDHPNSPQHWLIYVKVTDALGRVGDAPAAFWGQGDLSNRRYKYTHSGYLVGNWGICDPK